MKNRTLIQIFPRNRYLGAATPKRYYPRERERLAKLIGMATKASVHFRVYDRSTNGVLDFEISQGAFGDELPAESARAFTTRHCHGTARTCRTCRTTAPGMSTST